MRALPRNCVVTLGQTLAATALVAGSAAMVSANAAVVAFTDRPSWELAAGDFTETTVFPGIPEFSDVASLTLDGGAVLGFDSPVNKRTIGSGWATWSGGYTGDVFATGSDTSVNATISDVSAFGLEMEPDPFGTFLMSLTLSDGSVITQSVTGQAGADFFGWVGDGVLSFDMSSSVDFAFGRFVEAHDIPEPTTTVLLGLGLLGIVIARRKPAQRKAA